MIPKLRAWEPYCKKMFANDQIIIWNGNVYVNDADKITVDNIKGWSIDDKYIMQSTGLFDVNGKEIFEGDVIVAMSQGVKATGEVKRRIDGYWLMYPSFQNREFWHIVENVDTGETGVEIIGNIYQNPELLEEVE
ncbi:TPA: YopX family protein [Streptococcus suis]